MEVRLNKPRQLFENARQVNTFQSGVQLVAQDVNPRWSNAFDRAAGPTDGLFTSFGGGAVLGIGY